MKKEEFFIGNTPAVLYGEKTDNLFIFVHGLCGNKYEAERFAEIAAPCGWQTLGIDLPEHGGRTDGAKLLPWDVIPELRGVIQYAKTGWKRISVRAVSVGTWFSLLSFSGEQIEKSLFSSPLTDMVGMIEGMMKNAEVSERQLEQKGEIPTDGAVLSWRYLKFARENPVRALSPVTHILYGDRDELIPRAAIERFAAENPCRLTEIHGTHRLHTDEELSAMKKCYLLYLILTSIVFLC